MEGNTWWLGIRRTVFQKRWRGTDQGTGLLPVRVAPVALISTLPLLLVLFPEALQKATTPEGALMPWFPFSPAVQLETLPPGDEMPWPPLLRVTLFATAIEVPAMPSPSLELAVQLVMLPPKLPMPVPPLS